MNKFSIFCYVFAILVFSSIPSSAKLFDVTLKGDVTSQMRNNFQKAIAILGLSNFKIEKLEYPVPVLEAIVLHNVVLKGLDSMNIISARSEPENEKSALISSVAEFKNITLDFNVGVKKTALSKIKPHDVRQASFRGVKGAMVMRVTEKPSIELLSLSIQRIDGFGLGAVEGDFHKLVDMSKLDEGFRFGKFGAICVAEALSPELTNNQIMKFVDLEKLQREM